MRIPMNKPASDLVYDLINATNGTTFKPAHFQIVGVYGNNGDEAKYAHFNSCLDIERTDNRIPIPQYKTLYYNRIDIEEFFEFRNKTFYIPEGSDYITTRDICAQMEDRWGVVVQEHEVYDWEWEFREGDDAWLDFQNGESFVYFGSVDLKVERQSDEEAPPPVEPATLEVYAWGNAQPYNYPPMTSWSYNDPHGPPADEHYWPNVTPENTPMVKCIPRSATVENVGTISGLRYEQGRFHTPDPVLLGSRSSDGSRYWITYGIAQGDVGELPSNYKRNRTGAPDDTPWYTYQPVIEVDVVKYEVSGVTMPQNPNGYIFIDGQDIAVSFAPGKRYYNTGRTDSRSLYKDNPESQPLGLRLDRILTGTGATIDIDIRVRVCYFPVEPAAFRMEGRRIWEFADHRTQAIFQDPETNVISVMDLPAATHSYPDDVMHLYRTCTITVEPDGSYSEFNGYNEFVWQLQGDSPTSDYDVRRGSLLAWRVIHPGNKSFLGHLVYQIDSEVAN